MWLLVLACNGGEVVGTDLPNPDTDKVTTDDSAVDTEDSTPVDDTEDTSVIDTDAEFEGPPRIVLFIGDGMGFDHVEGGGILANGTAGSLRMEAMPVQGRLRTASLTGLTDSAASGTAMASGQKTWNGAIGQDRDKNDIQNIMELARAQGMATAIVTSDEVIGATPSSFTAHVSNRGDKVGIIEDLMATPPDVLLGGGFRALELPVSEEDVNLVRTKEELAAFVPDGRPLFGLFFDDTLPWVGDEVEDRPSLAVLTQAALTLVQDDPEGFLLVVEGARIDHASHGRMADRVLQEVVDFDDAVGAVLDWEAETELTIVVTADHECGGLALTGETVDGLPEVTFRRSDHTNEDVPVFAQGPRTAKLHDARLDNTWVHAVLKGAVLDEPVVAPVVPPLVDGYLEDVGSRVVEQAWHSDFGDGHNQLDALRLSSDPEGLRIGVDGIFEDRNNLPLVLLDLDFGQGTGLGTDGHTLGDFDGTLDSALSALSFDLQISGLGFDVAIGGLDAEDIRLDAVHDRWGIRGVGAPWMNDDDLFWLHGIMNYDDGNIARDHVKARDAADPTLVENGWEILVPWMSLYQGPPPAALEIAAVAVTVDKAGTTKSNQSLPAYPSSAISGSQPIEVGSVLVMSVATDGTGGAVTVHP